jgi:hypothetical protein
MIRTYVQFELCGAIVTKPATPEMRDLLDSIGLEYAIVNAPAATTGVSHDVS